MGLRFIPFHPEHRRELGYYAAELYYEYLKLCAKSSYVPKDQDGFFERSVSKIKQEVLLKRSTQEKARDMLIKKGWINVRRSNGRSPTVTFRIEHE